MSSRLGLFLSTLIAAFICIGCGENSPPDESAPPAQPAAAAEQSSAPVPNLQKDPRVAAYLQQQVQMQRTALDGAGRIEVHSAWHYTGFSFLSPDPNAQVPARLVAVDATISGHTAAFDIDDVEIVDGVTNYSYGSRPHFAYLDLDTGELLPGGQGPAPAPKAQRVLLIYGFPKNTKSLKLAYWNKIQTAEAVPIAASGWGIPHPPTEKTNKLGGPGLKLGD